MTLGSEAGTFLPVQLLDLVIPVVESRREVSRGATGLSATNGAVIDDDHGTTRASEKVCSRHPCDSGSNNAHASTRV
jgi:hypothetical protein